MSLPRRTQRNASFPISLLSSCLLAGALAAQAAPPPAAGDKSQSPILLEKSVNKTLADCRENRLGARERLFATGVVASGDFDPFPDLLYLGCKAAAAPQEKTCALNPGPSAGADASARAPWLRGACAAFGEEARLVWNAFKAGPAAPCELLPPDKKKLIRPDAMPAVCAAFADAARKGQPRPFCDGFAARGMPGPEIEACKTRFAYLEGQPGLCDAAPDVSKDPRGLSALDKAICRAKAELVAALRSGRPPACASLPLCQALAVRSPAACEPYEKAARASFCDAVGKFKADFEAGAKTAQEAKNKSVREHVRPNVPLAPVKDPQTEVLRAKADQEAAAAKKAAQEKTAAEIAKKKFITDELARRRDEQRKKNAPPMQMKKGDRLQAMPPEVKKRLDALEKKGGPETESADTQPKP